MSDETHPERSDQHSSELSPLDQAFLASSQLRMVGEETSAMAPGMTPEVFGNAELAAMVQQFTQNLGSVTTHIADRMDQDLGTFAQAQHKQQRGDDTDHG